MQRTGVVRQGPIADREAALKKVRRGICATYKFKSSRCAYRVTHASFDLDQNRPADLGPACLFPAGASDRRCIRKNRKSGSQSLQRRLIAILNSPSSITTACTRLFSHAAGLWTDGLRRTGGNALWCARRIGDIGKAVSPVFVVCLCPKQLPVLPLPQTRDAKAFSAFPRPFLRPGLLDNARCSLWRRIYPFRPLALSARSLRPKPDIAKVRQTAAEPMATEVMSAKGQHERRYAIITHWHGPKCFR